MENNYIENFELLINKIILIIWEKMEHLVEL
jgi:hypothetical protein